MKGKLEKIGDKWYVRYLHYDGGGSFRLPLIPKNQEYMNCFLYVDYNTEIDFKEVLLNPMGREVDPNNLGQNHSECVWYAKLIYDEDEVKDEQKQHLIDIMRGDEELGLYDEELEPYVDYLERLKERRTEDNYKYSDEDFIQYDRYITDCWLKNLSVYKCLEFMCFAEKEIKLEDVFNDEKSEGVKRVIHQHKVLKGLSLVNPLHLEMTSNGHGEFPDGYKLTEKGIQYIIEQLNKE
jgi:hypothetical protein